jgi:hypothetical protein
MISARLTSLKQSGYVHYLLAVPVVLAVAIIGYSVLSSTRAAVPPYTGYCVTHDTISKGTDNACARDAQTLLNGLQWRGSINYGLKYASGSTVTYKGKNYLVMDGDAGAYTTSAITKLTKKASLTTGKSGTWQTLCDEAVDDKLVTTYGGARLVFGSGKNEAAPGTNKAVFNAACGTNSTGSGSTSTGHTGSGSNATGRL